MNIKILGPGCPNCRRMEENTLKAVQDLGLDAQVEKVTQWDEIMSFGITASPGLVVDGLVRSFGKVLTPQEIATILKTPPHSEFSLKV